MEGCGPGFSILTRGTKCIIYLVYALGAVTTLLFIWNVAHHSCCATQYHILLLTFPFFIMFYIQMQCTRISLKLIVKIYVHLGMNMLCIEYPWQSHFKLLVWPALGLLVRHLVTACNSQVHKQIAVSLTCHSVWDLGEPSEILHLFQMHSLLGVYQQQLRKRLLPSSSVNESVSKAK